MNLKVLTFTAMMGALGNILFALSETVLSWGQVALDISHIGTLIAAVYGGPLTGLIAGLLVGLGPGLYFGYIGGSLGLLGLIGLPLGKALTGVFVGLLARWFKINERRASSLLVIPIVLIGYVPECIFTIFLFEVLVAIFLPLIAQFLIPFLVPILIKALIEMGIMSFFMAALFGNNGFKVFVASFFTTPKSSLRSESGKSLGTETTS